MEDVRERTRIEFVEKTDEKMTLRYQSRLLFDRIHKSYQDYDSYTIKKKDIRMEKPIDIGFALLELSKFLLYGTYYEKLRK